MAEHPDLTQNILIQSIALVEDVNFTMFVMFANHYSNAVTNYYRNTLTNYYSNTVTIYYRNTAAIIVIWLLL